MDEIAALLRRLGINYMTEPEGIDAEEHAAIDHTGISGVPGEGFAAPDPLPEVPATPDAQDVTDALVELGLVTQAEV